MKSGNPFNLRKKSVRGQFLAVVIMLTIVLCGTAAFADEIYDPDYDPYLDPTVDPSLLVDDPATLFIGNGKFGSCPTGTEVGCPESPNSSLGANNLSIFLNGAGQPPLTSPLALILGIPVMSGGPIPAAPVITSAVFYDENGAVGTPVTFGTLPILGGHDGQLNAGDANAYTETGYNSVTNASNNWTNWGGVVPGASYFSLFVYRLNQNMDGKDVIDVTFGGAGMPLHTIAIAYGCYGPTNGDILNGSCDKGTGKTYSTPFTEAGFVVPEPTSLLLLGTGLLGIGKLGHKYRNRKRSS